MKMEDSSSNFPRRIVHSAIVVELLKIIWASNNPDLFSETIKPLNAHLNRQGVSIEKINNVIIRLFHKRPWNFDNVCPTNQEMPEWIS